MDNNDIQLIGGPCGQHGPYTFYKAFKYTKNGVKRIVTLSEFFFVKLWIDSDLLCIGELQLLWVDKNSDQVLSSLRLYFLPENTPDGRTDHGEDEVLAISEKVVIRVEDLITWITVDAEWTWGSVAKCDSEVKRPKNKDEAQETSFPRIDGLLDFSDVEKERCLLNCDKDERGPSVVILSYPRYCRYRAMMKRLEGVESDYLKMKIVCALGGFTVATRNTRVLFCKDTFDYPELEGHELLCNHLAPKLKGRPRGRRKKRSVSPGSESNESECSVTTAYSSKGKSLDLLDQPSTSTGRRSARLTEMHNEGKDFIKKLHVYMKENHTPIGRVPSLGYKEIDLYGFFMKVHKLGGYNSVTRHRLWKSIFDEMSGHQNSTSAATVIRRHYERLLLPYERHLNGEHHKPLFVDRRRLKSRTPTSTSESETTGSSSVSGDSTPVPSSTPVSSNPTQTLKSDSAENKEPSPMKPEVKTSSLRSVRVKTDRQKDKLMKNEQCNNNNSVSSNNNNSSNSKSEVQTNDVDVKTDLKDVDIIPVTPEDSDIIKQEENEGRTEMIPVQAEINPVEAEIIPVQAEVIPVQAEINPEEPEIIPVHAEMIPVQAEIIPAEAEIIPVQSEIIPVQAEITPVKPEEENTNEQDITVSPVEEEMKKGSEPAQDDTESVPILSEILPTKTDIIPKRVEMSPIKIEITPVAMELPNKTEAFPLKTEIIPVKPKIIPRKVEIVSSRTEIAPIQVDKNAEPLTSAIAPVAQKINPEKSLSPVEYKENIPEIKTGDTASTNSKSPAVVEVPYKSKSPDLSIESNTYKSMGNFTNEFKKRKLDILKEGGLEVTPVRSFLAPNLVKDIRPSVIHQPSPKPSISPKITKTDIQTMPPPSINTVPSKRLNISIPQTLNISAVSIPNATSKTPTTKVNSSAANNHLNGHFPPKVLQSRSIYSYSEKIVYGNPRDALMQPVVPVHTPKFTNPSMRHSGGDILDLSVSSPQKPIVEIMRVPNVTMPSQPFSAAREQPLKYSNKAPASSIIDGRRLGSNLEITLVGSTNKASTVPNSPVKASIPPSMMGSTSSRYSQKRSISDNGFNYKIPRLDENGKYSRSSSSSVISSTSSTRDSRNNLEISIPNVFKTPSNKMDHTPQMRPTQQTTPVNPKIFQNPTAASQHSSYLSQLYEANKSLNPYLPLIDPALYYSAAMQSLYSQNSMSAPPVMPFLSQEQLKFYSDLMAHNARMSPFPFMMPQDGSPSSVNNNCNFKKP